MNYRFQWLFVATMTAMLTLGGCGGDAASNTCEETNTTGLDKFAVASLNDQLGGAKGSYSFDANAVGSGVKRTPFQLTNTASALTAAPLRVTGIELVETDGAGAAVTDKAFRCEMADGSPCTPEQFPALVPVGYADTECGVKDGKTAMGFDIVYDGKLAAGPRKAALKLSLSGDPQKGTITVSFVTTLGEPRLACDPKDINFGSVTAGNKPMEEVIKCRSIGTAPVQLSKIELFSTTKPPVTVAIPSSNLVIELDKPYEGDPALAIKPGQSLELRAQLGSLSAQEQIGATVQVSSNDPTGPHKVFISANASGPCLKPSPGIVDFGEVALGQPTSLEVLLDSCGTEVVTLQDIAMKQGSSADLKLDFTTGSFVDDVAPSSSSPLEIQPSGQESFRVVCTPSTLAAEATGTVVLTTKELPAREIPVSCKPAQQQCPVACIDPILPAQTVVPQTPLTVSAKCSTAGAGHVIDKYTWSVKQPGASLATLKPNNKVKVVSFQPNIAGDYTFTLEVADEVGTPGCGPISKVVTVVPDNKLHVELTWETAGDKDKTDAKGADLDLHIAHPKAMTIAGQKDLDGNGDPDWWWAQCYDNFWLNANPEWGDPFDVADNPNVDLDDTDGWGPENLSMAIPETDTWYAVGVYVWDDANMGPSKPRIRIYIDKELVIDRVGPMLSERDMWCVGEVSYDPLATTLNAKAKLFRPCKGAGADGNLVTPKYPPVSPTKNLKCQ